MISQYVLPKFNIESSSSERLKSYLDKHNVSVSMIIRSLPDDNKILKSSGKYASFINKLDILKTNSNIAN